MIADSRGYARERLDSLGYVEWTDGFNWKNIPNTKLDESYLLEMGEAVGVSNNQDAQVVEANMSVRLFKSPSRSPKNLIDEAVSVIDTVVTDFVKTSNRTTYSGLKNVEFVAASIEPLDDTNDNGVVMKITFKMLVYITTY